MYKTKLISVRVDEEALSVIDNAAKNTWCYSRSSAINAALRLMAAAIDRGLLYKILVFDPHFDEVDTLEFEHHKRK